MRAKPVYAIVAASLAAVLAASPAEAVPVSPSPLTRELAAARATEVPSDAVSESSEADRASVEATALAVSSGEPAVVEELTTPTTLTTALPDGTMQLEESTVPVRVDQGGAWVPVDTK
ncbi:hypothetical protein J2Y69_003594 [Microbacterium resistens]|uniref:Secreted protein n=1 Tax=Microbacterium resistens TaxID=156977 RepID=A0ABU1SH75_9MICO|nr:hypothetical protein [Microbacterium resistens]MDR6868966.1 hypothetical protein [Microbacterium resistens]